MDTPIATPGASEKAGAAVGRSGNRGKLLAALALNFILPVVAAWLVVNLVRGNFFLRPAGDYGAIRLKLQPPGTAERIPEPLIVCGIPGKASLVYIRFYRQSRAKVGIEFWGYGAVESDEFDLPAAGRPVDLVCSLPVFLPPVGNAAWGAVPRGVQRTRRTEYVIEVEGTVRLKGPANYEQPVDSPVYLGTNPVGGSLVSSRFTGTILAHERIAPGRN